MNKNVLYMSTEDRGPDLGFFVEITCTLKFSKYF